MAKAIKKNNSQPTARDDLHVKITAHDRQEKEGGIRYTLSQPCHIPGFRKPIETEGRFVECNDGYYQAYDHEGNKMHFRLSGEIIESIFKK